MLYRCWLRILKTLLPSALLALAPLGSQATVTISGAGISSVGTPVSFSADFTISGNTLTLALSNTSPSASLAPNDVLGSFYWDIIGAGGIRPNLTLSSAVGGVYLGDKDHTDPLETANANLNAVSSGIGWVFRNDLNTSASPGFAFGLGAVGNARLAPNNFDGNLVSGIDYGLYRGDVTTQNLDGKDLVKERAVFTFTGTSGFTEANIVSTGAFGLGTAPDSMLLITAVPEPSSALLVGMGLLALVFVNRR
jgi:PEP-CTERM motif